jgi:hypothetical protein
LVTPATLRLPGAALDAVGDERHSEVDIDDTLAASFPASDPPAWNPGFARPGAAQAPRRGSKDIGPAAAHDGTTVTIPGVINVSRPDRSKLTLRQGLISLGGAGGIALLVPFAILLVGLPIALAVRGLLEAFLWLLPGIR